MTQLSRLTRLAGFIFMVMLLALTGCRGNGAPPDGSSLQGDDAFVSTSDPALSQTLQAQAAATAAQVAEGAATSTPTTEPLPTLEATSPPVGTPLASLTGPCETPAGFTLHVRDSFCIAAPESWTPLNVDGGLAASLDTTPGQAIGLRPGWAEDADICTLMIYVTSGSSALENLDGSYTSFQNRAEIAELSAIDVWPVGDLAMTGFTWAYNDGESGGVYADVISPNRLVRISFSGQQCPADNLIPVLSTLRFNAGQP